MKSKFIDAYMDVAQRFAQLSSATRLQVGAIVVKDDRIISIGYNGMPTGWDNCCENTVQHHELGTCTTVSKAEVLHAETNAIAKLAKSGESGLGATMFVTHAPCIDCAKLVYQSGIATVYYKNKYRSTQGLEFLNKSGVEVIHHHTLEEQP
jgi:dCMP deaminase